MLEFSQFYATHAELKSIKRMRFEWNKLETLELTQFFVTHARNAELESMQVFILEWNK